MTISSEDVRQVARLARLRLTEEEVGLFQEQLGRVLEYMRELDGLDTGDVEPAAHILGLTNVLRDDKPRPPAFAGDLLEGAPAAERGYFKVPKVIE